MQLFAKSQERSCKSWFSEIGRVFVRFDHIASFVKNADESVADCIAALPPKSQFRYGCLVFVTRNTFYL